MGGQMWHGWVFAQTLHACLARVAVAITPNARTVDMHFDVKADGIGEALDLPFQRAQFGIGQQ